MVCAQWREVDVVSDQGEANARAWREWVAGVQKETAARRIRVYAEALERIACLSEGERVHGGFDEPASARIAREALASQWYGPCAHGRDPFDRCDDCGEVADAVAWALAKIAEAKR